MYVTFLQYGAYGIKTYAFHKLECAFVFAAYSITISDWTSVLHILKEESTLPFLFKRWTLVLVNLFVITVCIIEFVECWMATSLMGFVNRPIYTIGLATQFVAGLMLTGVMLHGGLKLSRRIRGASGSEVGMFRMAFSSCMEICAVCHWAFTTENPPQPKVGEAGAARSEIRLSKTTTSSKGGGTLIRDSQTGTDRSSTSHSSLNHTARASAHEFAVALNRLNMVMLICASTIFIQLTLLLLNYLLGYASESNQSVGPTFFFWIFYAWFPLWGTNCSLMFLVGFKRSAALPELQSPKSVQRSNIRKALRSQQSWWSRCWSSMCPSADTEDLEEGLMTDGASDYDVNEPLVESALEDDYASGFKTEPRKLSCEGDNPLADTDDDFSAVSSQSGSIQSIHSQSSYRVPPMGKEIVFFRDMAFKDPTDAEDYTYQPGDA
jgi:hypothetical protein